MDKLIKLLNEYKSYTDYKKSRMSEYVWANVWDDIVMDSYVWTTKDKTLEIISKEYWFIKWLVDNDKVDWNFIDYAEIHQTKRELESNYQPEDIERQYYEKLLMLLSIQDNPIEFLILVLR